MTEEPVEAPREEEFEAFRMTYELIGSVYEKAFSDGFGRGFAEGLAMAKTLFVASIHEKRVIDDMFDIEQENRQTSTQTQTPGNPKTGDAGYQ